MIKIPQFFLLIICILVWTKGNANDLSPIEKKITHSVEIEQQEQLLLLKKLVNINSDTTNIHGVYQVGEILRSQFKKLGFKTYWVKEPSGMQRAGTLVAKRRGHKGKRLLLIGHLDTVFSQNSSFQHFHRVGKNATGPGVVDDKGGDVVILYALKALEETGALKDTSITVILTGDEENSGKPTSISRKPLIEAAHASDIALDFESSLTLNAAIAGRRGITDWVIETKGNETHSSEIFEKEAGYGAIYELARILNMMRTELAGEKYLSFSPGLILGGTSIIDSNKSEGRALGKTNVIAKTAIAKGDLRFLTEEQKAKAEKAIINIVTQHLPGTTASVTFQDGIPSMPPTKNNLELLEIYSEVSKNLGYGAIKAFDPGLRGAGDISHIASIVLAGLGGLGPAGDGLHSVYETIDLTSLPIQTQRVALLIYRLTQA